MTYDTLNEFTQNLEKFLLSAAKMAMGDIDKRLTLSQVEANAKLVARPDSEMQQILDELDDKGFIKKIDKETFSITYEGIYFISEITGYPIESLGILSQKDISVMISRFNRWISEQSLKSNEISMDSIKKEFGNVIGEIPIRQIIDVLEKKGVIKKIGNESISLEV